MFHWSKKSHLQQLEIFCHRSKNVLLSFFSPQKFRFSDTIFFSLSASFQFFLFCPSFNEKPFLFSNLHHNVLNFDTMLRCLFEYSEETHAAKNLVLVHSLPLSSRFFCGCCFSCLSRSLFLLPYLALTLVCC